MWNENILASKNLQSQSKSSGFDLLIIVVKLAT